MVGNDAVNWIDITGLVKWRKNGPSIPRQGDWENFGPEYTIEYNTLHDDGNCCWKLTWSQQMQNQVKEKWDDQEYIDGEAVDLKAKLKGEAVQHVQNAADAGVVAKVSGGKAAVAFGFGGPENPAFLYFSAQASAALLTQTYQSKRAADKNTKAAGIDPGRERRKDNLQLERRKHWKGRAKLVDRENIGPSPCPFTPPSPFLQPPSGSSHGGFGYGGGRGNGGGSGTTEIIP